MSIESSYWFSEVLEQRAALNEKERMLRVTQADREWLRGVFLSDHQARQALKKPMLVESLSLSTSDSNRVDLAGAFLMTSGVHDNVFVYTPCFGIERFDTRSHALGRLTECLNDSGHRDELLRFVAAKVKATLDFKQSATVSTELIRGGVFPDRRRSIDVNLESNRDCLLVELLKLPTLRSLLIKILTVEAGRYFAHVSLDSVTMISYSCETTDTAGLLKRRTLSTHSLTDALLKYYTENGWPRDQCREFVAPGYSPDAGDIRYWEMIIEATSTRLIYHFQRELKIFWSESLDHGHNRQDFFIEAMGTAFRAELFKQKLSENLSVDDYYWLSGLYPHTPSRLTQVGVRTVSGKTTKPSLIEIANTFQTRHDVVDPGKSFLYTGGCLKTFDSSESLEASIQQRWMAPPLETLQALSLQAQADLLWFSVLPEGGKEISLPLFQSLFNTILDSQLNSILYIIKRFRDSEGKLNLDAAFDIGLDIRAMVDRQLLSFDFHGRWSTRLDLSSSEYPHTVAITQPPAITLKSVKQQLSALETLKNEVLDSLAKRPQLMTYAEKVLSRELIAVHRANLTPTNIYINHYIRTHTQQASLQILSSTRLVDHLLERSVGLAEPLSSVTGLGLFSQSPEGTWLPIDELNIVTANRVVTQALQSFLPNFLQQHRSAYMSIGEKLIEAVDKGLRNEARQRELDGSLEHNHRELLSIVLDSPDSERRASMNGFIPDAFLLTLKRDELSLSAPLFNCFMITERGGLDRHNSGDTLLWTPERGLETFDSPYSVEIELNRRLLDPVERLPLLENSVRPSRTFDAQPSNHRGQPRIGFELIEQGFLSSGLQSLIEKTLDEITYTASLRLSANNLHHYVQSCLAEHPHIECLTKAIDATRNNALRLSLPAWLANSGHDGQWALAALFDSYRQQPYAATDWLDGIPSLQDFTRTKLSALLHRDFPQEGLDPDQLTVSTILPDTKAVSGLSLVVHALQHVKSLKGHASIVRASGSTPLPNALTGAYLKSLIKEMAIGSQYASLLSFSDEDSQKRQNVFRTHLLWQALEHGFTQVLQKRLSNSAYHLIKQIMGMPDGLARSSLDGRSIILRPCELLTSGRLGPDRVRGLYLIGPSSVEQGPQVLFATHGEGAVFSEYSNEAAVLRELSRPGELQKNILSRLSQAARQHYENTVFTALAPDVRMTNQAVQGNVFTRLYNDYIAWFKDKLNLQHIEGEHHAWDFIVSQLKTDFCQGERFMLGRLRLPLAIWQTFPQLKDATDNVWKGNWKMAMEEFAGALAQLALARKRLLPALPSTTSADTPVVETETETVTTTPYPQLGWAQPALTREQLTRLRSYEVTNIALSDLNHDTSLNIYTHVPSGREYAAVGGSVFLVGKENERWRILTDVEQGPWIKKDTQGQWSLDLQGRLLGGGPVSQWLDRAKSRRTLSQELEVQAVGMQAIKRLYPNNARKIRLAHELAVTYLNNAKQRLQSLTNDSRLDHQRHAYVKELFGVSTISRSLRQEIENTIDALLQTLLDPERSPATSDLYVVGTRKKLDEPCVAFVLMCDVKKKIHLSEQFFEPNLRAYQPIRPRTFDILLHSMASALLHEFSHVSLDTVDISYLNAFHPFYDLIDTSTPGGQQQQRWLKEIQDESLSHRTPVRKLFRIEDALSGSWTDVQGDSLKRVLQLTGANDLYQARSHFLSDPVKRASVILANADSVSLLISHLGRPIESYPLYVGVVP